MIDPLAQLYMLRTSQTPGWPSSIPHEKAMLKVGSFAKAIVAGVSAGTGSLVVALGFTP